LFKAYEWKEFGRLGSINNLYDILGDIDTTVQPVRNGWISLYPSPYEFPTVGGPFNYNQWHSGFGDLSNAERIHAGRGHSDYWTNEGVDTHLKAILCENKR
jgi:hypothetical protein